MTDPPETPRCRAIRADGHRCEAKATAGDGYCYWHHPDLDEERRRARRKGGRKRAEAVRRARAPSGRLGAVLSRLERTWDRLDEGDATPRHAEAAASLAGAMVDALVAEERSTIEPRRSA